MTTVKNNLWEAHSQWASRPSDERFETLADLRASVAARRMASRSVDVDIEGMHANLSPEGLVTINSKVRECEPNHWSLGQLSGMMGAPASYLRTLPKPLLVDCLNHGFASKPRETMKFMTIAHEEEELSTLQAVTSPTYGRIWDADVVDAAGRIVERSGGRFFNPRAYAQPGRLGGATVPSGLYASDRDVFIFMIDGGSLLDIGERAQLNRGFFLWNSEVGSKTFGVTTFLFNQVCGNHIVWGASEVNTCVIRHTKNGPYRFDSEAAPALLKYANETAAPIESAVRRAIDYSITAALSLPDGTALTQENYETWARSRGKFSRSEIREGVAAAVREEGECRTLWQFVQGLTAYARGFDFIDARTELETRAGKLLDIAAATAA